jgi:hypothetical protein
VASKSAQDQVASSEDIEEMLDGVDKNMERIKTLYEQYFLGIQKQAPTFLHTDIERKLRDLTQLQVRNTGLRYRLATLQQKFGAYNSYWKRTLRQIENGTYARNLSKIGREAVRTGAEIPEEILAAMPKRMREQVVRDRDAALAIAKRRRQDDTVPEEAPELDDLDTNPTQPALPERGGAHVLKEDDDFDMSAFFASLEEEDAKKPEPAPPPPPVQQPLVAPPPPVTRQTGPVPLPSINRPSGPIKVPSIPPIAPSQATRPNPVAPGAAAARGDVPVESMNGPFARPQPKPAAPALGAAMKPPPGMTDADVNTLYQKYVQAKQLVGEATGPREREKLLKTINAQAPKIMEQYKAKGVDFTVVVKDNQVVIRAKPKT